MEPRRLEKPFVHDAGSAVRSSVQSKSILEEVLRETIAGLSSTEQETCCEGLSDTIWNEPRTEFTQQAASALVRFATPQWVKRLITDEEGWLALTSEITRILWIDKEARLRLERIWSRIGE